LEENRIGKQGAGVFQGAGWDSFVERVERRARRSSWHLAFKAFSSARAPLTSVSSVLNRN